MEVSPDEQHRKARMFIAKNRTILGRLTYHLPAIIVSSVIILTLTVGYHLLDDKHFSDETTGNMPVTPHVQAPPIKK